MGMEEKKKDMERKAPQASKVSLALRIGVAAYLLYTVFLLVTSLGTAEGMDQLILVVAIVVFTLISLVLGFLSIRSLLKVVKGNGEEFKEQDGESSDTRE